jgi:hypothetical protein
MLMGSAARPHSATSTSTFSAVADPLPAGRNRRRHERQCERAERRRERRQGRCQRTRRGAQAVNRVRVHDVRRLYRGARPGFVTCLPGSRASRWTPRSPSLTVLLAGSSSGRHTSMRDPALRRVSAVAPGTTPCGKRSIRHLSSKRRKRTLGHVVHAGGLSLNLTDALDVHSLDEPDRRDPAAHLKTVRGWCGRLVDGMARCLDALGWAPCMSEIRDLVGAHCSSLVSGDVRSRRSTSRAPDLVAVEDDRDASLHDAHRRKAESPAPDALAAAGLESRTPAARWARTWPSCVGRVAAGDVRGGRHARVTPCTPESPGSEGQPCRSSTSGSRREARYPLGEGSPGGGEPSRHHGSSRGTRLGRASPAPARASPRHHATPSRRGLAEARPASARLACDSGH